MRPRQRPAQSGWATTALFATVALALAAGCGTRLSDDEIQAGGAGNSSSGSSSSGSSDTGSGTTDGGTTDGGSASTTTGSDPAAAGSATSGTSGTSDTSSASATSGTSATSATTGTDSDTSSASSSTSGSDTSSTTGKPANGPVSTAKPAILGGDPGACKPATGSTVQLGNVSTLSGVLGELFKPVVPALNLFVKSQNACGGLNGHVIKLQLDDDQGDPSTAVTAINRQISSAKVLAFVGNIQVLTVDAIVPIINSKKIPVIGADITNDTWYTNPYFFPQGAPPQAVSFGYIDLLKKAGKTKIGNIYCLEVPVACKNINDAYGALAPILKANNILQKQVSITAPSYTSQCLEAQKKGVTGLALTFDAASAGRFASSCAGLRPPYRPQFVQYPLGLGNEQQFFGGGPNLGGTLFPGTTFPWYAGFDTPAGKYFAASKSKFGFSGANGNAASLGWTSGALLVAASVNLPADNPKTSDILKGLYSIKGDNLGGLSAPKLSFKEVSKGGPAGAVQYCYYPGRANAQNTGFDKPGSTPVCTTTRSPTDPNQ